MIKRRPNLILNLIAKCMQCNLCINFNLLNLKAEMLKFESLSKIREIFILTKKWVKTQTTIIHSKIIKNMNMLRRSKNNKYFNF